MRTVCHGWGQRAEATQVQTAKLEERKILRKRRLWKAAGPRGTEDVVSLSPSSCAERPPDPVSHPDRRYHPLPKPSELLPSL